MNLARYNKLKGWGAGGAAAIVAEELVRAAFPEFHGARPELFWDAALLLVAGLAGWAAPANAPPPPGSSPGAGSAENETHA